MLFQHIMFTKSHRRPRAAWAAMTTLTFLKPRLKSALLPAAGYLAQHGVTANQVTVGSILGSIAVGAILMLNPDRPGVYALLPAWLLARTAFASIDGALAIEFGQKSRLGGFLNEAGDLLSEMALFAPLVRIHPFTPHWIAIILFLIGVVELVGIVSASWGAGRRCEGPFGKSDRAAALGLIGLWLATCGALPQAFVVLMPTFSVLLLVTAINRVRFAFAAHR